jgi:beta-galactosidase
MVNYAPGKLEAFAYKKGRKLTAMVETTGPAYRIVVHPSRNSLTGDGNDAIVFNVTVVDREGREVPDAQDLLHFSVTEGARIIGVGNGNPSSHEPDKCPGDDWHRHLFNGKCQVIVESRITNFTFTVTGDGLQPALVKVPIDSSKGG